MKELTIKIKYDDTDGYTGNGEFPELVKECIEREIDISMIDDNVIKSDYEVVIESNYETN